VRLLAELEALDCSIPREELELLAIESLNLQDC
jgi:hypothetical protein